MCVYIYIYIHSKRIYIVIIFVSMHDLCFSTKDQCVVAAWFQEFLSWNLVGKDIHQLNSIIYSEVLLGKYLLHEIFSLSYLLMVKSFISLCRSTLIIIIIIIIIIVIVEVCCKPRFIWLSPHPSLSLIVLCKSSRRHPVSVQTW